MKKHHYFGHTLYDKFVFGKLRALLGGRVEYMFSGGAPLNKEVMEFF